jgi:hypothetical protein
MSFWEWFTLIAGAASLISLAIGLSSLWNGRATRAVMRTLHQETQRTLVQMDSHWREAWERMDQRADERHREVVQAIQALRG